MINGKKVKQKSRHFGGVTCFLDEIERTTLIPLVMMCTHKNDSDVAKEARNRSGREATVTIPFIET